MQREIKFRGFSTDFGWRYGDFTENRFDGFPCIWQDGYQYEVDIDTVGQYTGLKDRNGKGIYEGDIVMVRDLKYQVVFKYAEWKLDILNPRVYCNPAFHSHTETSEVIGNIYENPEYLNQSQEDTNE